MSQIRNSPAPQDPVIPDKLYFRIGEVARLLDVETHTLRFWETEFPQLKVGKGGTGQRLYRRRDVELVLEIKHLLYQEGYTIPGARQMLQGRPRRKDAATKSEAVRLEAPREQPSPREPKLERLRDDLRDLSALLSEDASSEAAPTHTSLPKPQPPRRGLHIAPRASGKSSAHRTLPGLFGPEPE